MGRRRRSKYSTVSNLHGEADDAEEGAPSKRPRLNEQPSVMKLSEEQEDRLGRWSSAIQWIIKIAQDRGSNACLAFSSARDFDLSGNSCKAALQTLDGQQVTVVVKGTWATKVASILSTAGEDMIIILSGIGAKIASSGNDIVFEAGKIMMEVIHAQSFESRGYLEVVESKIITEPRTLQCERQDSTAMTVPAKITSNTPDINTQHCANVERRISMEEEPLTLRNVDGSYQTPARSHNGSRESISATPAWLKTPAADSRASSHIAGPSKQPERNEVPSPLAVKTKATLREAKTLGTRLYTPIALLRYGDRNVNNVIALTTTDHTVRRSLSGTRDWKITIGLIDLEDSADHDSSYISFNLFSPAEEGIPRCKPGSILLLRGMKMRTFNGNPQGNGYAGQFEWAFMDTSEAVEAKALNYSEGCNLSDAEQKELKRQYDWYRKRNKGRTQAPPPSRHQRPLIKLSAVQKEVFFDTTVEIVKLWSGSLPPEIYVTDYTAHPQFYAANDVHLGALSREELYEQQEDSNDAGNGRVLAISLWDDQQQAINSVHVGMLVRLENVRPKMQTNGYLCGSMGGGVRGTEERLKVVIVKESSILEDFRQRKNEYLEEIAVRRVEKQAADATTKDGSEIEEEEEDEEESPRASQDQSSHEPLVVPTLIPPPGQKPLTVVENRNYEQSDVSNSAKTTSTQESSDQEELPTFIKEEFSTLPLAPLEQLKDLSVEQLQQGKNFHCRGRVYDMMPRNIDDIVEVICGICRSKLPTVHAFCAKCAEEDGKDLQYRFHFALLVEGTRRKRHDDDDEEEEGRIPVVIRDEEAKIFLHGFHPKDVRNRKFTMDRLKQRLLPLLGSELVYGKSPNHNSQEQKPLPFKLAINASIKKKSDGTLLQRFNLIGTRLGKQINH